MSFCQKCGTETSGQFCAKCGASVNGAPAQSVQQQNGMRCPRCGGSNIVITTENLSAKTKQRGNGCLWAIGRFFLIVCTCGLWLLVGRRKGTANTRFKNQTVAICQSCGNKWEVG